MDAIVSWGMQERLGLITCPTLTISADEGDPPVALKEHYVTLIPGARLAVIENSRQAMPLDPAKRFNQPRPAFLQTVATSTKDH